MQETLDYVHREIMSLWKGYCQAPFVGMDCDALAIACAGALASQHIGSQ